MTDPRLIGKIGDDRYLWEAGRYEKQQYACVVDTFGETVTVPRPIELYAKWGTLDCMKPARDDPQEEAIRTLALRAIARAGWTPRLGDLYLKNPEDHPWPESDDG